MNNLNNTLSLEQEFSHRSFSDRVRALTREEAQELLIVMHKQMLYRGHAVWC